MSRRILLLVQYDGTDFNGWQVQSEQRTVQAVLEGAISGMTQTPVRCRASSRTDAGVHARGLPVMFETETHIPLRGFERGLNGLLPWDLSIVAAAEVGPEFDVRRSSLGKTYSYQIWNGPSRSALLTRAAWHVPMPLDVAAMAEAAVPLLGEHDFSSYRAASCQARTATRRLTRLTVEGEPRGLLRVTVEGNAFLQHMVRILVGTLVEVGRGFQSMAWPGEALAARSREAAGPTAPGRGLCLERVRYDPDPFER